MGMRRPQEQEDLAVCRDCPDLADRGRDRDQHRLQDQEAAQAWDQGVCRALAVQVLAPSRMALALAPDPHPRGNGGRDPPVGLCRRNRI